MVEKKAKARAEVEAWEEVEAGASAEVEAWEEAEGEAVFESGYE
jgi:hypothetical protein